MQRIEPARLVLRPLSPAAFWMLGAGLALLFAAYCQLHGVVEAGRVPVAVSLAWGLALALPWWSAWEGCKRLGRLSGAYRAAALAALLLVALLANVSLHYVIGAAAHPEGHARWVELFYGRFPLALGLALGALLLRPWQGAAIAPATAQATAPVTAIGAVPATDAGVAATGSAAAVARALPAMPAEAPAARRERAPAASPTLHVPTRSGTVHLPACDLDYVRAAGNYVELVTQGRSLLLRATLQEVAATLAPAGFVRIHRSLLVNPARVARLQRDARKLPALRLVCGATLPVGRRHVAAVERLAPRLD